MKPLIYIILIMLLSLVVVGQKSHPIVTITGKVTDMGKPAAKTEVELHCIRDGTSKEIAEVDTKKDGTFKIKIVNKPKPICIIGDSVFIEVEFEGVKDEIRSKHVVIEQEPKKKKGFAVVNLFFRGQGNGGNGGNGDFKGVPEFNIVSAALAVVITGMGLVFLRR